MLIILPPLLQIDLQVGALKFSPLEATPEPRVVSKHITVPKQPNKLS
jgi:hypothetical protein